MVQEQVLANTCHFQNSSDVSPATEGEEMSIVVVGGCAQSSTTPTHPISSTQSVHPTLAEIMRDGEFPPTGNEQDLAAQGGDLPPEGPPLKIQKVPQILKDITSAVYKSCFEPMVVSLGPYHYGKPKYKHMEELKIPMMEQFIAGTGRGKSDIYKKFQQVAQGAKDEYYRFEQNDNQNVKDDKFIDILFVDSCFMVQFILSQLATNGEKNQKNHMQVKMKVYEVAFVIRDMFLLENQLPYPLVKSLMMFRFEEKEIRTKIKMFIDRVRFTPVLQPREALFLKKIWKMLSKPSKHAAPPPGNWDLLHDPPHLLHALQTRLVNHEKLVSVDPNGLKDENALYSYRSVSDLIAAGVDFKAGKPWGQFTDIWFHNRIFRSPVLIIPPIIVDDSTPALLLNLVAFESLPDAPDDLGVTSYLCFLDTLIDTAEDVKELRSKGILVNFLGSDEQVAVMFNSLTDQLVPNMEAYVRVKADIEQHFCSRKRVWWAQWLHAHFNTPWATISFFAAAIAIFLSFVQAYFAIYPRS